MIIQLTILLAGILLALAFAWWHRPVPNVDTINQSKETKRVAQKIKREEKEATQRVVGQNNNRYICVAKKTKKSKIKLDLSPIHSII